MKSPIAVLISDIHFTPATLDIATVAFKKAQIKALDLKVTLIVCGDTLDTKAIMRGECVNRLLEILSVVDAPPTIFVVGNHDLINEKSNQHTLNFIKPKAIVVDTPQTASLKSASGSITRMTIIPYQSDLETLKQIIDDDMTEDIIIMHQGIKNAKGGHYYHDATAIDASWLAGKRVISGHYHERQTIELPGSNKFDYIGNPYSLSYGEANDPEKGFQVLYDDGSLEFIPTKLRKHVIVETVYDNLWALTPENHANSQDLVQLKISGTASELQSIDRAKLIDKGWPINLKLDLIPNDTSINPVSNDTNSQEELLDLLIDNINNSDDSQKQLLKNMWREFK